MVRGVPEDVHLDIHPRYPRNRGFGIGVIGAGFIVRDVQLVAYRNAGFRVVAIASRREEQAQAVAQLHGVPRVYGTWQELLRDQDVEIVDVAFPPDRHLEVIREACQYAGRIKGILCQKPLAMDLGEAREIVRVCREAGVLLAVNSNMRYDQSMRALKSLLASGELGEPVFATIELRATPRWQEFLKAYDRLTLLNISIHHVDTFRFLFGEPDRVTALAVRDPRTTFPHRDGIVAYGLEYERGLLATAWDDVYAWPGPGTVKDVLIRWRLEGTEGYAQGTIGWPYFPQRVPSTLSWSSRKRPDQVIRPEWDEVWFPDAFEGTMAELLVAVEDGEEPSISGQDGLRTMAVLEALYTSLRERRSVNVNTVGKTEDEP